MRRRQKYEKNPLLDETLIGPLDAARMWGYNYGDSFKSRVPEFRKIGQIRTVDKLKGRYYVLEDLLRIRYPHASDNEIQDMVREHKEEKVRGRLRGNEHHTWIGAEEATMILDLSSEAALKATLRGPPKIRRVKRENGTVYNLRDCFARLFEEANDEQLDTLIIEYKKRQLDERSRQYENSQEG